MGILTCDVLTSLRFLHGPLFLILDVTGLLSFQTFVRFDFNAYTGLKSSLTLALNGNKILGTDSLNHNLVSCLDFLVTNKKKGQFRKYVISVSFIQYFHLLVFGIFGCFYCMIFFLFFSVLPILPCKM